MKRLVYAPRTYLFIKDQQGKIHDLTRYVVSGSVNRVTDAVSSASFTIRNPDMMFTTRSEGGELIKATFSPMDPITVYMRRMKDHPVRVFTGFLDETPYLELFPGTITFEASCTLKRLQYTFFDPSLPYMMKFMQTYGWEPNGDGSGFFSTNALAGSESGTPATGGNPGETGDGDVLGDTSSGSPVPGQAEHSSTHETGGLPGYPAYDYTAKAGTPCVAPVGGKVTQTSGKDPRLGGSPGGPLGYSIFIQGDNGKSYFLTHLDKVSVKVGDTVKQGQQIAVVANGPASWSSPHVHMGVKG